MRDLMANNRELWYAVYLGKSPALDENGDYTGEDERKYADPVSFKANLSATRGTQGFTGTGDTVDWFGADVDYALIISTANMKLPINEHSLIWDAKPEKDEETGEYKFDDARYKVTAVARGKVQMKYAIKRLPETELL